MPFELHYLALGKWRLNRRRFPLCNAQRKWPCHHTTKDQQRLENDRKKRSCSEMTPKHDKYHWNDSRKKPNPTS